MSEQLDFRTPRELQSLSLDQLRALWELVPTDRQRSYRAAYDREVLNAGAVGSDVLEAQVAAELLRRYNDDALVPVGSRWARTPERVQNAARANEQLDEQAVEAPQKVSPRILIGGGIALLVFVVIFTLRLFGGGGSDQVALVGTVTVTPTPTPEFSPTPTPLAIEIQDDVIEGGDAARSAAYPVNLQMRDDTGAPHVWVVQRRGVKAAEWNYDPSPDIASFVNGMSIRPVIGIPYSEDNAALFAAMKAGTDFTLTMNTGAILRFEFADKTEVLRSDTRIFRQVGPGLVLLLIGEVDEDGLPTATRTLVTATYPPEQELARDGILIGLPESVNVTLPTPVALPTLPASFVDLDVEIIEAATLPGQLNTRLWLYNDGDVSLRLTSDDITLALGYGENPPGPRSPAESLQAFDLMPGQALDLKLMWHWNNEPFGTLNVGGWRFGLQTTVE